MSARALPSLARASAGDPTPVAAVTAVLAAMAMVVLDAGMMNVALPAIGDAFGVTAARSVQVVSAYQVAIVMFLLPCAALGEALGLRKLFTAGLVTFSVASAIAASASSFPALIAARFVQGVGAAAIMALGVALLRHALPTGRLAAAIGWNSMTVALCSAAGPMASAAILTAAGWPVLLLVHLPLGALALIVSRRLPAGAGSGRSVDCTGIAISAAGFGAVFVGLGAIATATLAAAILVPAGIACFLAVARHSRGNPAPVIPVDLLGERRFRTAIAASVCCFMAQTSGLLVASFYLQDALGLTPLMTGLYMTPWPGGVAVAALASARVLDRYPHAPVAPAGAAILAAGLAGAAAAASTSNPLALAVASALCGIGFGLFQVANNRVLFLSAPAARSAAAGGLQGTARLSGQTAGAIAVALLFDFVALADAPPLTLIAGSLFALFSAVVSRQRSPAKDPTSLVC